MRYYREFEPEDYRKIDEAPVNYMTKPKDLEDFSRYRWLIHELEDNEAVRQGGPSFDYTDLNLDGFTQKERDDLFKWLNQHNKYYYQRRNGNIRVAVGKGEYVGFFTKYFVHFGEFGIFLPFVVVIGLFLITHM